MKLKAEEGKKMKLQLEAENRKCIHVNSNTKRKNVKP